MPIKKISLICLCLFALVVFYGCRTPAPVEKADNWVKENLW